MPAQSVVLVRWTFPHQLASQEPGMGDTTSDMLSCRVESVARAFVPRRRSASGQLLSALRYQTARCRLHPSTRPANAPISCPSFPRLRYTTPASYSLNPGDVPPNPPRGPAEAALPNSYVRTKRLTLAPIAFDWDSTLWQLLSNNAAATAQQSVSQPASPLALA